MLYKKIHRQFVREFQVGRRYRFNDSNIVSEITREPYIGLCYISTNCWYLINLATGKMTGVLHDITFLD